MIDTTFAPYRGSLTPAQAAKGILVASQNAEDLLEDAELLLKNGRWPRASALATLAIEEISKVFIIRGILLEHGAQELREGWTAYRTHTIKNRIWLVHLARVINMRLGRGESNFDIGDVKITTVRDPNVPVVEIDPYKLKDKLKQMAFYTDALDNEKDLWSTPSDLIKQKYAESEVAEDRRTILGLPGGMKTEAELELWVKHMRPVWRQDKARMRAAIWACYDEAKDKGVLSGEFTPEKMAEFMGL